MRDEFANHTREQLLEELEAARLRLAFYDRQARESDALEADEALRRQAADMQPEVVELIDRSFRQQRRQPLRRQAAPTVWKALKAAACILLVGYIGLSTALAFSPTVRRRLMGLRVTTVQNQTLFGLDDWQTMEVPDGWAGDYYPSYVPEGFTLHYVENLENASWDVEYISADRQWYIFSENTENSVSSLGTRDAEITDITIHDRPALLIRTEDLTEVVWAEFNRWFSVTAWTSADVAADIARSVIRIK